MKNSNDRTLELSSATLKSSNLYFTDDINDLSDCNTYVITVPTPVDRYNNPDMSPLRYASEAVGKLLKKNDVVIYESTVYPGATEEYCIPIIEEVSKLKYNKEFFAGYSPERINPGDKKHSLTTITKITSGSNKSTSAFVDYLYDQIISAGTHKTSSIAVAEAAKVIENTQRDVNIALVNELSILFHKIGLDTSEVLEAAETKWNFLPFKPGLVGGHCIGVDPYYLTYKAKEMNYHPEIILAGRRINDSMSKFIFDSTVKEMTKRKIDSIDSEIAILGVTFKENCPDLRNTKVIDLIELFTSHGSKIYVNDAFADHKELKESYGINSIPLNKINQVDVVVLAVAHDKYKFIELDVWKKIIKPNGIFIDIKALYPKYFFNKTNINHWRL